MLCLLQFLSDLKSTIFCFSKVLNFFPQYTMEHESKIILIYLIFNWKYVGKMVSQSLFSVILPELYHSADINKSIKNAKAKSLNGLYWVSWFLTVFPILQIAIKFIICQEAFSNSLLFDRLSIFMIINYSLFHYGWFLVKKYNSTYPKNPKIFWGNLLYTSYNLYNIVSAQGYLASKKICEKNF